MKNLVYMTIITVLFKMVDDAYDLEKVPILILTSHNTGDIVSVFRSSTNDRLSGCTALFLTSN